LQLLNLAYGQQLANVQQKPNARLMPGTMEGTSLFTLFLRLLEMKG
jgi:hypothetical protein